MSVKVNELKKLCTLNRLSDYLPYLGVEDGVIFLDDGYVGLMYECIPAGGVSRDSYSNLLGMYEHHLIPPDSILQWSLSANHNINRSLARWYMGKTNTNPDIAAIMSTRKDFYLNGTQKGLFPGFYPREFTLTFSIKIPFNYSKITKPEEFSEEKAKLHKLHKMIMLSLENLGVCPTPYRNAKHLFNYLYSYLNPGHRNGASSYGQYDSERHLKKQIIDPGNSIEPKKGGFWLDGSFVKVGSFYSYPDKVSIFDTPRWVGDYIQDYTQISVPFTIHTTMIKNDSKKTEQGLITKRASAEHTGEVKGAQDLTRYFPRLQMRSREFGELAEEVMVKRREQVNYSHSISVFGENEDNAIEGIEQAITLFRHSNITIREETFISPLLFLQTLPLGFSRQNEKLLQRTRTGTSATIAHSTPIVADPYGSYTPGGIITFTRRGQVYNINPFGEANTSYGATLVAPPGGGKTVLLNEVIANFLAEGAIVRVIEKGRGQLHLADLTGGQHLDFTRDSGWVVNPFTGVVDIKEEGEMITRILFQMAYPDEIPNTMETTNAKKIIGEAVHATFAENGNDNTIDAVYEWCKNSDDATAKRLATHFRAFTGSGEYGVYFSGKSNVKFDSQFVVLELDSLDNTPDLQSVMLLTMMLMSSQAIYKLPRDIKKLFIVDEAWALLKKGASAEFIESFYRVLRKWTGAPIIATQTYVELMESDIGKKIIGLSNNIVILKQDDMGQFHKYKETGELSFNDHELEIISSLRRTDDFAEMYVQMGGGNRAAVRLVLDPFFKKLVSSKGAEYEEVKRNMASGMNIREAVKAAVERSRG